MFHRVSPTGDTVHSLQSAQPVKSRSLLRAALVVALAAATSSAAFAQSSQGPTLVWGGKSGDFDPSKGCPQLCKGYKMEWRGGTKIGYIEGPYVPRSEVIDCECWSPAASVAQQPLPRK